MVYEALVISQQSLIAIIYKVMYHVYYEWNIPLIIPLIIPLMLKLITSKLTIYLGVHSILLFTVKAISKGSNNKSECDSFTNE